jgi:hypothetical protein
MSFRLRIFRPNVGRNSAAFREWQRIRRDFDSPLWRVPQKDPRTRPENELPEEADGATRNGFPLAHE